MLTFNDDTGKQQVGKFELQIHASDCWTASGPASLLGSFTITDTTGRDVTNPVNAFDGTLVFAIFAGVAVEAEVRCGETTLQCLLNREADLTPGRAITLRAKADACLVLPEE